MERVTRLKETEIKIQGKSVKRLETLGNSLVKARSLLDDYKQDLQPVVDTKTGAIRNTSVGKPGMLNRNLAEYANYHYKIWQQRMAIDFLREELMLSESRHHGREYEGHSMQRFRYWEEEGDEVDLTIEGSETDTVETPHSPRRMNSDLRGTVIDHPDVDELLARVEDDGTPFGERSLAEQWGAVELPASTDSEITSTTFSLISSDFPVQNFRPMVNVGVQTDLSISDGRRHPLTSFPRFPLLTRRLSRSTGDRNENSAVDLEGNENIIQISAPVLRGIPVTSGINRLSLENLLRAFHFADAADLECRLCRDVIPEVSYPIPIILSQVCQLWCGLSISTPSLWTNVVVDDRTPLYSESEREVRLFPLVDCFISLSKPQPLYITILLSGTPENPSTFSTSHANMLGNILFHNSKRVKRLTMRGLSWELQYAVMIKLAGTPMPVLETFNCDHGSGRNAEPPVYYIPNGNEDDSLPLFTSHVPLPSMFPLLRDVCLTSTPVVWKHFNVVNLTTLVLAFLPDLPGIHDFRPSYAAIHQVLHHSRRTLHSLTLAGILICQQPLREARFRLRKPFPLSTLEDLHLAYEDPLEVRNFLVGIAFPELKRLDLVSLDRTKEAAGMLEVARGLPSYDSAAQPGDQLEDDSSSEESDEDNEDGDEGDESFELSFTISVSSQVFFDESVCSELTVQFFDKLKALRTFDVSEPDSATIGFFNQAIPDSMRPVLPQLAAIRIAFVDNEFSDTISTFLTARAAKLDSDSYNRPSLLTKMVINGPQHSISQLSGLISNLTIDRLGVNALVVEENEQSVESGTPRTYRYTFSL
ncbi:uncharacterized protein ARMOST_15253 [Armillaria ostoyae]|uniref:F-box domain-containing protein n=1 Tax=Armillaria ostoyae TaxID=47428 RepID=A0A284RSW0_ARMOS|nr:uncharacterized protein ARMOST_15253 [Armillaria ostoyae]